MATNLGTGADATTFNIANMKPETNDQGDSLWAQNAMDNMAFLRYGDPWAIRNVCRFGPSHIHSPSDNDTLLGTQFFHCLGTDSQGTIHGTAVIDMDFNLSVSKGSVTINGVNATTWSDTTAGAFVKTFTFVMDNTYTIGNQYDIGFSWEVTEPVGNNVRVRLQGLTAYQYPTKESVP